MKEEEQILQQLQNLNSLEKIRELITGLGFSYVDEPLSTRNFKKELRDAIEPGSLSIIGRAATFPVVFFKKATTEDEDIDKQLIRLERELIKKLPPEIQDASIVIAASHDFKRVHLLNAKRSGSRLILRRFLIGKDQNMRTAAERLAYLKLEGIQKWDQVITRVEDAFDREEVTESFFKDFERVFKTIKDEIVEKQKKDEHLAHQFLHALLNRLMFIYYVQRKGWLADGDIEFVKMLWTTYQDGKYPPNSFYDNWLRMLFFFAFNNKPGYQNKGLPKEIEGYFADAPFLNGGLFKPRFGIDDIDVKVTDEMFELIFNDILNHYNFTVTEDTPFDQNIAVDPEMLGIVYESLVNTTELSDERKEAGIFYTPRVEVDFMCRRSLVEYLANHSSASREELYQFIFPEEEEQIVPKFGKKVRNTLNAALLEVTVVDPACGSGAFLVGMMQVIIELRQELAKQDNALIDEFTEKKRVIERSLYGVDVKEWAISVAQLRLWLTLIEVADDKKLDLKAMKYADEALLPSLAFKLRAGDSLVQEIAGITLPIRRVKGYLSPALQTKITFLRKAKTDFYFNRGNVSERDLKLRELSLYESILDDKIAKLDTAIKTERNQVKAGFQQQLADVIKSEEEKEKEFSKHKEKEHEKREKKIKELLDEKKELQNIKKSLPEKTQLFWSIEFAEIFTERGGFDVVIGNPPYVKHQKIVPSEFNNNLTATEYKKHILKHVSQDFKFVNLAARSDIYVYFFVRGLSLLNPNGTMCYITSNTWLDTDFGTHLQSFILKTAPILGVFDSSAKKSFKRAEINTVITFLGAQKDISSLSNHNVKFTLFKGTYEECLYSDMLFTIDSATSEIGKDLLRTIVRSHSDLYLDKEFSHDSNEDSLAFNMSAEYRGHKWGGRYFKAPDFLTKLFKEQGSAFRPLKCYADVGEGKPTGANSFFYVPKETIKQFNLPEKYLSPAVMNTRGMNHLVLKKEKVDRALLQISSEEKNLPQSVRRYIKYGEQLKLNTRKTFKNKKPWFALPKKDAGDLLIPCGFGDKLYCIKNHADALASNSFSELKFKQKSDANTIWLYLNSTFGLLLMLLYGREGLGGGLFKLDPTDVRKLPVFSFEELKNALKSINLKDREIPAIWHELSVSRETLEFQANFLPIDRKNLDKAIFDLLGLSESDRIEVYQTVVRLVVQRLDKSKN